MAKTKAKKGTKQQGKGAKPKYLGVKLFEGQKAKPGQILVRQRGTKVLPGKNVKVGRDHTLFALESGKVRFRTKNKTRFDGSKRETKVVDVV